MTDRLVNAFKYFDVNLPRHNAFAQQVSDLVETYVPKDALELAWKTWEGGGAASVKKSTDYVEAVQDLLSAIDKTRADNWKKNGRFIIEACLSANCSLEQISYILATASWESLFAPIKEFKAKAGTKVAELQARYWGSGFYGRGFVQLTWKSNYQKMGKKLGVDLVSKPDLALDPKIAASILVTGMMAGDFTGLKLSDFIEGSRCDYVNARKVVNGLDKADIIAGFARTYEGVLRRL